MEKLVAAVDNARYAQRRLNIYRNLLRTCDRGLARWHGEWPDCFSHTEYWGSKGGQDISAKQQTIIDTTRRIAKFFEKFEARQYIDWNTSLEQYKSDWYLFVCRVQGPEPQFPALHQPREAMYDRIAMALYKDKRLEDWIGKLRSQVEDLRVSADMYSSTHSGLKGLNSRELQAASNVRTRKWSSGFLGGYPTLLVRWFGELAPCRTL